MLTNLIEQDQKQREFALNPRLSFIVQAPAGSGKTELLIQRMLVLLTCVKTPEEILAITFTKKAANEMRLRVINALKRARNEPEPESQHAKKTWLLAHQVLQRDQQLNWNLINNPNQLRIQTIDALCTYLTKQLPLLSHFGSQPSISDNPEALYREAIQEILMHVEENYSWSQAISNLLLHLDNDLNKLHDLLVNLLAKRDQWLPYIQINTSDVEIKKQLEKHLQNVIQDNINAIITIFPREVVPELLAIARFAADNLALKNPESEILFCRDLTALPTANNKPAWIGLAKLLLTKSFSWRKRVDEDIGFPALSGLKNPQEKSLHGEYRQRLNQLITCLSEHEDLRLALSELFFLPEGFYHEAQWDVLRDLLLVLKVVVAQLRLTFQQYGQIDFIENAQAARVALGNDDAPTDLALTLDYQIQHILVDEFQDTAFTQYQLLEKLINGWEQEDGRTLFVVGDPMQSIYRFREAEVGLFIRMRQNGIGHIKLIPLTLSLNFRSTCKIVEWNNKHFQSIFPTFNDIASGAVSYSPSAAYRAEENEPSIINMRGFADDDDGMQAQHIVTLIADVKKNHPHDKIAILVRSRSHLANIIPALKKAKLDFQAVDIDPLASKQTIQDLLSLTCALLHPADRIAWLAVLRAPWCGLTLADLLVLSGSNPYAAIWEQLNNHSLKQKLSVDGQQRVAKILPILSAKIAERERSDLRTWIENTWLSLGGPACLPNYEENDDVQAFFKLLSTFNQNNLILNLDKLKEKINQLFASTKQTDATQIMTIHTAKGLEFDTVILPHLERKMPSDDKSLLLWMERPLANDKMALLLAPIHATGDTKDTIYEYIHRQQRIKSDYEIDRLLYVATTRAKKRLYLFFSATQKENQDFRVESGSFLDKMWPFVKNHVQDIIFSSPIIENDGTQQDVVQKQISRLSTDWVNPIQPARMTSSPAHQQQSGFLLPDNTPKLIGIVAHQVLQQISLMSTDWWQQQNEKKQEDFLSKQLLQHGMLPSNLEAATLAIQTIIRNTIHDERGLWILHPHAEARSEFALTAMLDDKLESLVIDRTFIDASGIRWIIDYKTTTFSHADLNFFLENEYKKYALQMQKYALAIKLIDSRPIRLGLYFPALPAWHEWDTSDYNYTQY